MSGSRQQFLLRINPHPRKEPASRVITVGNLQHVQHHSTHRHHSPLHSPLQPFQQCNSPRFHDIPRPLTRLPCHRAAKGPGIPSGIPWRLQQLGCGLAQELVDPPSRRQAAQVRREVVDEVADLVHHGLATSGLTTSRSPAEPWTPVVSRGFFSGKTAAFIAVFNRNYSSCAISSVMNRHGTLVV